ncbi:3-oxoacyl-[acyl-carrier-protein] reductase 1 [Culex quinquefasciatus]|uniref:3-oxoacyl-[acyl-carrier-protein] reductase 1 n=1 Tax=Culex quinquefasciatus TaxID=7176 RepID=B0WCD1_CULQU|nr:3-oxoacyl-[acyl-carrier-protein] reductase 1 [Culex quinquefasciatus]|eukprot:XP_001846365.1 3-oxoacyl-[acyl-carrier-protein] reductase 1 [Culex quinquefasciatus]
MDRWAGKVAVVTGASSGIGAAIVKSLANAGMVVVGLARRVERVEALRNGLKDQAIRKRLHAVKCDVSKEEDILRAFRWIEEKLGGVDVLVNNAGVLRDVKLVAPGNTGDLREVIDTNVMGLILCSREAFQSMKKRSVDGHIVHINSVVGHYIPNLPVLSIYPASKYAVTALTETMRREFLAEGTKIKVTSISPGVVKTDMVPNEMQKDQDLPMLEAEDVAAAVVYAVGTPPRVQIHELTIRPVGENF